MADTVKEWSVAIELMSGFVGQSEDYLDAIHQALEDLDSFQPGGVSINDRMIGFHLCVPAPAVLDAVRLSTDHVLQVTAKNGLQASIVSTAVKSWNQFEAELEESNTPQLAGVAELAEILGVSKQRVSELADAPGFPQPLARLRSGPVWDRRAIGNFQQTWRRTPGRPPAGSQKVMIIPTKDGWQARVMSPTGEVLGQTEVFSTKMHAMEVAKRLLTESRSQPDPSPRSS
jgi:hypothetical protein